MPVLDEIEAFFADQPEWQQRAYAALRSGIILNDTAIGELMTQCIKEASFVRGFTLPKLTSLGLWT